MLGLRGPGNVSSLEVWEFKGVGGSRGCGSPGGEACGDAVSQHYI